MNSVEVRLAQPDDAAVVAQLLVDFNTEFDEPTPSTDEFSGRLLRLLEPDTAGFFALIAQADIAVGVAVVALRDTHYDDAPLAQLEELYVRPSERGRGVGAALLVEVEARLKGLGVADLAIAVDSPDTGARRFYERAGYSCLGGQTGEPMLLYERSLGGQ